MLILFLDDQDVRHDLVEKYLSAAGHKVLHAFDPDEGLEIMAACQSRIGLAMLDHDMDVFGVRDDGSKYEKHGVWFIAQMFATIPKDNWPASFIIHSWNIEAAKNMIADLRKMDQTASAMSFCGDMLKQLVEKLRPQ